MNREYFKSQVDRLQERFGERAFDNQLVTLIWKECHDMDDMDFKRAIDTFLGTRHHTKPPLLTEFRESRLAFEKSRFQRDVQGAAQTLNRKAPKEMVDNMRKVLSKEFGEVVSVAEALEIARIRIQTNDDDGGAA